MEASQVTATSASMAASAGAASAAGSAAAGAASASMASSAAAGAAWAALVVADPSAVADRDGVGVLTGQVRRVRGWLDAFEVQLMRRARVLAAEGRSEAPETIAAGAGGRSSKEAGAAGRREELCATATTFEAALAAGEITSAYVDAVAAAVRKLDDELRARFWRQEARWLTIARNSSVDAFTRKVRDEVRRLIADATPPDAPDPAAAELERQQAAANVRRWVDRLTGMHHTMLELDPLRDAAWWSAVDAQLARLKAAAQPGDDPVPFARLQADAVVAAVSAGEPAQRVPSITALVDYDTLVHGLHDHGICEMSDGTPLPVATVRRLCCDAEIIPTMLNGDGVVIDQGRERRTATRDQRRALRAMHRTCAHWACTVPFEQCRIHHVRWWWKHLGPTDLDNLLPLCEAHHHLVHEGGWGLTMTPARVCTWTRPDGTTAHQGPTIDRAPNGVARRNGAARPDSGARPAGGVVRRNGVVRSVVNGELRDEPNAAGSAVRRSGQPIGTGRSGSARPSDHDPGDTTPPPAGGGRRRSGEDPTYRPQGVLGFDDPPDDRGPPARW